MTGAPAATGTAAPEVPLFDPDELAAALSAAPSVHNTQPWRIRRIDGGVQLRAERRRWLPGTDSSAREMRLSCGAGLLNLRLAVAMGGRVPVVSLMPDPTDLELIATVRPGPYRDPTAEERALSWAVPRRRSDRRPFRDEPVALGHRHLLRRAAEREGAWMRTVDDPAARARLHGLFVEAHRAQRSDPGFCVEWAGWTGRPDGETLGVPLRCGGAAPHRNDPWMVRDFTHTNRTGVEEGAADEAGTGPHPPPLVLVIGTHHDLPVAHVRGGQALQRVLLTATALGLSASILSAPVEVRDTRRTLAQFVGPGTHPQILVRVGHGHGVPVTPSPRLPFSRVWG